MNKKSFIIGVTTGLLMGAVATTSAGMWVSAYKNDEVRVNLLGEIQTFTDAKTGEIMYPLTYNDRTYLPIRNIAEMLGLEVDYDDENKTVLMGIDNTVPESGYFAQFCQELDNVQSEVLNSFADLKVKYAINGEKIENEQIYIEIATGNKQNGTTEMVNGCQKIEVNWVAQKELPYVRERNDGWYITKDGSIFNATGYVYDGKTYWTPNCYTEGELSTSFDETRVKTIAESVINNLSVSKSIMVK